MTWSPVVELRQYTLHPGARDTLIELFDTHFVESQEQLGMKIIGQFRDLDEPDRFTWLRGFPSMSHRPGPLQAFYTGQVWRAHAKAANATMIDSDNVLLLRPVHPGAAFRLPSHRPERGTTSTPRGTVVAMIVPLEREAILDEVAALERDMASAASEAGGSLLASFVTEDAENNFPALPVREGEHVVTWFLGFDGMAARGPATALHQLASSITGASGAPSCLRLGPTPRSHLGDEAIQMACRRRLTNTP